MTDELKDIIRNFIVSWDNTINDETMGLADCDLFLETAISLLEETIKENNDCQLQKDEKMNVQDIEKFISENKDEIKVFFEKNPKENLYTTFVELTDKNLDIISKLKVEYEQTADYDEKTSLEQMINNLVKCVSDSLSTVPTVLSDNHYFRE
jgi:hypothetical protein